MFISRAEGKKGPDGASKQPLKTSQAPGTHSLLREASSYIVSNIQNALTHDIQYDLVYTTFEQDFFLFPLGHTVHHVGLFFFNVNYLFFNCFTELCWFLPNINSMWDLSSLVRDLTCTPAVEPWSPNRWITREVPVWVFVILLLKLLAFTLLISFTTNSDFCITVQAQGVFFFFAM